MKKGKEKKRKMPDERKSMKCYEFQLLDDELYCA
jgi:hypothetical protein